MLGKIPIIWKKASSKKCFELNSLKKCQWAHMSASSHPSPQRGARSSKYYNVQKWQLTFTLEQLSIFNLLLLTLLIIIKEGSY